MKNNPDMTMESALWNQGYSAVAGIDEAGRGAWAGPVMAAAVILPNDPYLLTKLHGVRDSKQMTAAERERMMDVIQSQAAAWAVGEASNLEIDRFGILPATRLAMKRAVSLLCFPADFLLIDYVRLSDPPLPQLCPAHGDCLSLSIAAASVLAKVTRDCWMCEQAEEQYPQYGFSRHKGYGTKAHREAIERCGCCPIHRRSFRPLARENRLF